MIRKAGRSPLQIRRGPGVLRAAPAVHKWPVGSILALRLSPEVLGLFHFYRRDGHLLRACEVIALTAA